MADVLLDTSFLLPTLGISVREISSKDVERIKEASGKNRLYCSYVSFVEILGLLGGKFRGTGNQDVNLGIRSLLDSGAYAWVNPSSEALRLAFELRVKGHKDDIDNILYSTAAHSKMLFLSIDEELKSFLAKHGYDTELMIEPEDLDDDTRSRQTSRKQPAA